MGDGIFTLPFVFTIGETYKFTINGTEYETECRDMTDILGEEYIGFGDIDAILNNDIAAVNFIAYGAYNPDAPNEFSMSAMIKTEFEITEFAVDGVAVNIVKIDEKYLPNSVISGITIAQSTADNAQNTADNAKTTAETNASNLATEITNRETADNLKMNKENPVGTGSFSMNRKSNTTIGNYSHTEGYDTEASGRFSHAEGNNSITSGECSHAEGQSTIALGDYSHAEGYDTIATGKHQHVQGKYNINDVDADGNPLNTYAHIVGNGYFDKKTYKTVYSNAHTLDWSGNAWYAGSVEGTALILSSPNGTRFNITVGDDGVLSATEITE